MMHDIRDFFYQDVIKQFIQSLYKRYYGRQDFKSAKIEEIKQRLLQKIKNPQKLFNTYINEYIQKDTQKHEPQPIDNENAVQLKQKQNDDLDSDSDDLEKFEVREKEKLNESNDDNLQVRFEGNGEEQMEENSDDPVLENMRMKQKQLKDNISMHIVGIYQSKKNKRSAYNEGIKIKFENAFVKFKTDEQTPNQVCFSKLQCVFNRVYMKDIHI